VIFKEEMVGGRKSVTTDEERVARRLKREKVVKIDRLSGCKNFVGVREWEKERERSLRVYSMRSLTCTVSVRVSANYFE